MAQKNKKVQKHLSNTLSVFILFFCVVVVLAGIRYVTVPSAQSYTIQKGAPSKSPKGIYNVVTGTVTDSQGQPISRARVSTWQKTVNRNFYTDQYGKYSIDFPYCNNCKSVINYSATGYQTVSIDTYQITGGTLVQDVVLPTL